VQRGHDPRDFTLVAGGGAGPLHAVDIARELGIPRVVVPYSPGLTSALGILHVDLRHDFQRSVLKQAKDLSDGGLVSVYDDLVAEAKRLFDLERIPEDKRLIELSIDTRYYGQTPYMNLPLDHAPANGDDVEEILTRYEDTYLREFGYILPRDFASIEFVNARVAAIGLTQEAKLPRDPAPGSRDDAKIGTRQVYFEDAGGFVESAIYDRALLRNGVELEGPAIVEQTDSTVVLPPGSSARVDEYLNLVVSVNGR
jgi:N-methylhydantoinase A